MNPKTKTLIILFLSFALGAVVGASFLSGTWRSLTREPYQRGSYRTYLYEHLRLDSVQIGRVDSLLDVYRSSMNDYRRTLQQSRDSLRTSIKELLSDDQRMRYETMISEMDKRDGGRRTDTLRTR